MMSEMHERTNDYNSTDTKPMYNGTDLKLQLLNAILSHITATNVPNTEVIKFVEESLQAYNFSLTPYEIEQIEAIFRPIDLGPKRASLTIVIPVTIIYSLIFVTGIVGNVCTCLVIIRNKYMRTVTNYYLFNLSVSDLLLLLLGLPQETYATWSKYPFIFGETFCRLRIVASEASSYVSILTITAFTIERYMAICHPIKFPTHPGLSRPLRVMFVVWIVSTVCAIPVGLQFGIIYHEKSKGVPVPESAQCNTINPEVSRIIFQVSIFIFFILPMSVISLLYFFIALAIRKSTLNRAGSDSSNDGHHTQASYDVRQSSTNNQQQARIRQSVLKMLVAVVIAFFLCWAPFHTQRLLAVYVHDWSPLIMKVHDVLFYISGVTYYLSATINPVLYSIMSLKFRQAFRSTLLCCCCCLARPRPRRRMMMNTYTFKFHQRAALNTHCSVVESSSSNSNNNKQGSNQSTPVLCCAIGNGEVATQVEGQPLVEMYGCDTQRGQTTETSATQQPNTKEKML